MKYLSVSWVKTMKNKLLFLTKMSLNKKIKTKWFYIANIIFLILIAGLINLDSIIKLFGGDFDDAIKINVIDNILIHFLLTIRNKCACQRLILMLVSIPDTF